MYQILRLKNQARRTEVLEFARQLVALPSPTFQEGQVAVRVEQEMRRLGYDRVFRDETGNVVGLLLGREDGPTVLLNCHLDSAARAEEEEDEHAAGTLDNGRLYGPGASDCKGGLAAQVYVGDLLKRSLLPRRGHLIVAATVAEEQGDSVGVRALLEHTLPELELKPDYAILGEPTGLGLYYGHDGWLEVEVRVEGANPFHVEDAARSIYSDFNGRSRQSDTVQGKPQLEVQRPLFEDDGGLRRARIRLNRRLRLEEQVPEILGQVKHTAALLARSAGAVAVAVVVPEETQQLYTGRTTVVRRVVHAWSIDPFDRLMERARQSLGAADCAVRAGKWELGRVGTGTAGSVLVQQYQVPTIGYGPGDESVIHAPGEYVEADKITEAIYGTAAIVHSLIGVPVFGWSSDEI